MLRVAKYAGLVAAILIGLVLGQAFGPINSLPSIVKVDDQYFEITRSHTLFLGFSAALAACAINLLLRISHLKVLLTLASVAALWFIWFEASEPDFMAYLLGALADFLGLMLVVSAPVVGAFWLIERKIRKDTGTRNP